MNIKKRAALSAIAVVTAGALAFGGTAAQADVNNGSGAYQTFGSDTTQDLLAGLATRIHTGGPSSPLAISTFDATPQPSIVTSPNTGTTIPRPDGSGQGFSALKAAETGTVYTRSGVNSSAALTTADVKFSRSSSGPSSPISTGTYSYIPFALDGVTFATTTGSSISNLTTADLVKIYSAANGASVSLSIGTKTVGKQGTGADIVPFVPQSGSGTRNFWLTTYLGLSNTSLAGAVSDTYTDASGTHDVQEHNGDVLGAAANAIVPFSISQWIAQERKNSINTNYGLSITDRRGTATLHTIDSTAPYTTTPAGDKKLNVSFSVTRAVFNVVNHDRVTSGTGVYDATLAGILAGTSAKVGTQSGLILGGTVVEDFGFGNLSTNPSSPTVITNPRTSTTSSYYLGETDIRTN